MRALCDARETQCQSGRSAAGETQQREARSAQRAAGKSYRQRLRIEREFSGLQRAAHQLSRVTLVKREEPRLDFLERERLDEVVVGAVLEALELVVQRVARGHDQYRSIEMRFLAQLAAQRDAVDSRQSEVEQDAVKLVCYGKMQRGEPVRSGVDAVAARLQEIVEVGGDRRIVLDDQNAHAPKTKLAADKRR